MNATKVTQGHAWNWTRCTGERTRKWCIGITQTHWMRTSRRSLLLLLLRHTRGSFELNRLPLSSRLKQPTKVRDVLLLLWSYPYPFKDNSSNSSSSGSADVPWNASGHGSGMNTSGTYPGTDNPAHTSVDRCSRSSRAYTSNTSCASKWRTSTRIRNNSCSNPFPGDMKWTIELLKDQLIMFIYPAHHLNAGLLRKRRMSIWIETLVPFEAQFGSDWEFLRFGWAGHGIRTSYHGDPRQLFIVNLG